ncbi:MAG: D-alanyl-D-alanine carboxypeptidase family protein [Xanthomonadaceae bacterium]|nr:D-alanyl-D-alanine carboxypeptidase family protein [Xanthomonadaceae bacterium]
MKALRIISFAALCSLLSPLAAQTPLPQPAAPVPAPMAAAPTPPPPTVVGNAWLLMDYATGQVLAGENVDARVEPASITKVMTSYVAAAEMTAGKIKPDDEVTISENAWRGGGAGTDGSTSFLPLGSKVKLDDLLHGMIVQSGNDASIAIAEHVAGSEEAFAALMNQYAQRLGMSNSHFVNAHGLSAPEHYSSAHDIALLAQATIRDFPDEYAYYKLKEFTFNNIRQHNRNTLLWRDPSVDGLKTGHHSGAGYCLAASAQRGEQRLISVVMGSSGEKQRADDSQALLNWGFRFFETHVLYPAATQVAEQKLWKGSKDTVALGLTAPLRITLQRGRYNDLKPSMDVPKQLLAPVKKGQALGKLRVMLDDKVLAERPLVALDDVPEGGLFKRLSDGFWMWWEAD